MRVKAVWEEGLDTHLAGDDAAVRALLCPYGEVVDADASLFTLLRDSGAQFPSSHRRAPGSGHRAAAEDSVEFWLEAREALGGEGPLARHFEKLRALHRLLPELRGDPHVGTLSQMELCEVFEKVTGEYCAPGD